MLLQPLFKMLQGGMCWRFAFSLGMMICHARLLQSGKVQMALNLVQQMALRGGDELYVSKKLEITDATLASRNLVSWLIAFTFGSWNVLALSAGYLEVIVVVANHTFFQISRRANVNDNLLVSKENTL